MRFSYGLKTVALGMAIVAMFCCLLAKYTEPDGISVYRTKMAREFFQMLDSFHVGISGYEFSLQQRCAWNELTQREGWTVFGKESISIIPDETSTSLQVKLSISLESLSSEIIDKRIGTGMIFYPWVSHSKWDMSPQGCLAPERKRLDVPISSGPFPVPVCAAEWLNSEDEANPSTKSVFYTVWISDGQWISYLNEDCEVDDEYRSHEDTMEYIRIDILIESEVTQDFPKGHKVLRELLVLIQDSFMGIREVSKSGSP